MTDRLSLGIIKVRPFGGVAFMWHKSVADFIKIVKYDADGRCLAASLQCDSRLILFINIYLPCNDKSAEYRSTVSDCVGFIDNLLNEEAATFTDIVILGDTNFACDMSNSGYRIFNSFMLDYNILSCDDLSNCAETYVNVPLKQASCIEPLTISLLALVSNVQLNMHMLLTAV